MHSALRGAREVGSRRKISVDAAKRATLEDGKPRRVGSTLVYINRGILQTKTVRGSKPADPIDIYSRLLNTSLK